LWVREFDDADKAPLSFWVETLVTEMKDNRGYTVVDQKDVVDASGLAGKAIELEVSLGGRPFREYMAVFSVPGFWSNTVRVAEYVAEKDLYATEIDAVRPSMLTIH
jgi:hypothetical protein